MAILEQGLRVLGGIADNAQNLEFLLKYRHRLVPFVGAGLSFDFGYPSWSRLLQDLADQAGLRTQVDALLARDQFEEAAEVVATELPNLFNDTLERIFDRAKLPRPLGKGAVRHLPDVAREGPVLTTNFDCVLEAAFEQKDCPFDRVIAGSQIRPASGAIQAAEHCLLKLHGDYYDADSRVITLTE